MIDERRIGSCADFTYDIMLLIEKIINLEGIFMNRFKKFTVRALLISLKSGLTQKPE